MRRTWVAVALVAAVAAIAAAVWLRPRTPSGEDAQVETEVAVRVARVSRATLRAYVTAYGVVEPEPPGDRPAAGARVAPAIAGVVAAVRCTEGARVEKGALLFQLDSRAADVVAERARAALGFAAKNAERQRTMAGADATSRKAVEEAEQALAAARNDLAAAETQQALLRVTAPLSGTVTRINVRPGEAVDLATTLADLADLDRLVARADVPQAELAALRAGQGVEVATGGTGAPLEGRLLSVGTEVDPKTGAATVRASLPPHSGARPGQPVTLRIVSAERSGCLAVPVESVVKDEAGQTVIAVVENDRAVRKAVRAGISDGGMIEVAADGLVEGASVVTEGAYALPKETKVRVLGK